MDNLFNAFNTADTFTANGAVTHSTSNNPIIDLFFIAGSSRNLNENEIIHKFLLSYQHDTYLTTLLLLWARDRENGAGERRFYQTILKYLINTKDSKYDKIINFLTIAAVEFGYWKDVFKTYEGNETKAVSFIAQHLKDNNGLCFKYMPRKGIYFNLLRKHFEMTPKEFRKYIVKNTPDNTVERLMCANKWSKINYKSVPSIALKNYKNAFVVHDDIRYSSYLEDVKNNKTTINTGVIYPYQLLKGVYDNNETSIIQWENLPNYMDNKGKTKILPVCDVSGSMTSIIPKTSYSALDVCVSLGLYISERNIGIFKDQFITFSQTPEMVKLKGNINDRANQLHHSSWGMSTNLYKVFQKLINVAIEHNLQQEDLPESLLIFSDMEFDDIENDKTNFESIIDLYKQHELTPPNIIFWNLMGNMSNVPVKAETDNVALISGFNPAILTNILKTKKVTPVSIMLNTLTDNKYVDFYNKHNH